MSTNFIDHLLEGDHASRPAFGDVPEGTLYACSDHSLVYQSDGASAWTTWATLGGGAPAAHASSHEDGGADEIDVTGLAGTGGGSIPNLFVGTLEALRWGTPTVSNGPAVDRAYFMKFIPTADITVDTVQWECVASAGNMDFGIYNEALNSKLGSTGSFASPGTGMRTQALTAPVALTAGTVYYFAAVFSSATLRLPSVQPLGSQLGSGWNLYGTMNSAGVPLPASITPLWEAGGSPFPLFFFTT